MGTARASLSFYGAPDSATVNPRHLARELGKERIDGMTEAGFQKVADRRVQINVLAALEIKTSPQRKKLQKHTWSSRSSRSNPEKPCPKSFPNKPGAVCPHDEFLIPPSKNLSLGTETRRREKGFLQSEYFPYCTHCMLSPPPTPVKPAPNACP
jgi:hypothetical protein